MLFRLTRLIFSVGVVLGECEFPTDHPDFTPEPQVYAQILQAHRVYEYADRFGDCSGCVRALNFCYRPHTANEMLFTVEIRNPGSGNEVLSRDVIVSLRSTDVSNCENYSPGMSDCCVEQVLAEPFTVNQNFHYSLRVPNGQNSLFLRHQSEMTNGRQLDLGSGQYLSGTMIPKPLFFFRIDTDVPNGIHCSFCSSFCITRLIIYPQVNVATMLSLTLPHPLTALLERLMPVNLPVYQPYFLPPVAQILVHPLQTLPPSNHPLVTLLYPVTLLLLLLLISPLLPVVLQVVLVVQTSRVEPVPVTLVQ